MRRLLLCLNLLLISSMMPTSDMAIAQEDPNCFWQNSSGQRVDLSNLCGTATPASKRMRECQVFLQTLKRTMVPDAIIQRPATKAQRERNRQIISKLNQSIRTMRAARFSEAQVREMQQMAIAAYQDMATSARVWNEIGAQPTQNQGFAVTYFEQRAALIIYSLDEKYGKTCAQKLL